MDNAAKEIVTNIIAAMTNAFQVSERLNTPTSADTKIDFILLENFELFLPNS